MKIFKLTTLLMLTIFMGTMISCEKDDDDDSSSDKVESNGLSKDINNILPKSVLDKMKGLGVPINTGDNPPNIENSYHASPFELKNSNISTDHIGTIFSDYDVTFSQQKNESLEIKLSYVNGWESGNGVGAFIVGKDNKFSVFAQMTANTSGQSAKFISVISGEIIDGGIKNLYEAVFMTDDNGDPENIYIENGEGRVLFDNDKFSPSTGKSIAKPFVSKTGLLLSNK